MFFFGGILADDVVVLTIDHPLSRRISRLFGLHRSQRKHAGSHPRRTRTHRRRHTPMHGWVTMTQRERKREREREREREGGESEPVGGRERVGRGQERERRKSSASSSFDPFGCLICLTQAKSRELFFSSFAFLSTEHGLYVCHLIALIWHFVLP